MSQPQYNDQYNQYFDKRKKLATQSNEIRNTTNTKPYNRNPNPKNYRYIGPYVNGYKEIPNVYDGFERDIYQLQVTQNSMYITGIIACTSLILAGVILGSSFQQS